MTSSTELRELWSSYECEESRLAPVAIPGVGRTWILDVAEPAVAAFEALARIMEEQQYLFRESAGGTYNCRHVNNDPSKPMSLHSYGIAIDLNPSKNGFGSCSTDMPPSFTGAVKALRTNNGRQVFSWGGDWWPCSSADPMHFQIDCGPADLNTGIEDGDDMTEDEVREIIRAELDRPIEGAWQEAGSFWGIQQAVLIAPIGNSGKNVSEHLSLIYKATDSLEATLSRLETKIDNLELEAGSGGISSEELSDAILEHSADADAHHE